MGQSNNTFIGGLNTDVNELNIKSNEYTFALNAVLQSVYGDIFELSNELGNINISTGNSDYTLDSNLKIIGHQIIDKDIVIFSCNELNTISEIGVIEYKNLGNTINDKIKYCRYITTGIIKSSISISQNVDHNTTQQSISFANNFLNFNINYYINSESRVYYNKNRMLYFTDDNSSIKSINLDRLSDINVNNFQTLVNVFQDKIKLPKIVSQPNLVTDGGGQLFAGIYQIAIRYKTEYNITTDVLELSNSVILLDDAEGNNDSTYDGNNLSINKVVNKSINFQIENIDTNFKFIEILVLWWENGTEAGLKIFNYKTIPTNNKNIIKESITDILNETTTITTQELLSVSPYYNKAKLVTQKDGILFFHNLEDSTSLNTLDIFLQQYACSLQVFQSFKSLTFEQPNVNQITNYNDTTYPNPNNIFISGKYLDGTNLRNFNASTNPYNVSEKNFEYGKLQDISNSNKRFNYKDILTTFNFENNNQNGVESFKQGEVYSIGIVPIFENGKKGEVYHIPASYNNVKESACISNPTNFHSRFDGKFIVPVNNEYTKTGTYYSSLKYPSYFDTYSIVNTNSNNLLRHHVINIPNNVSTVSKDFSTNLCLVKTDTISDNLFTNIQNLLQIKIVNFDIVIQPRNSDSNKTIITEGFFKPLIKIKGGNYLETDIKNIDLAIGIGSTESASLAPPDPSTEMSNHCTTTHYNVAPFLNSYQLKNFVGNSIPKADIIPIAGTNFETIKNNLGEANQDYLEDSKSDYWTINGLDERMDKNKIGCFYSADVYHGLENINSGYKLVPFGQYENEQITNNVGATITYSDSKTIEGKIIPNTVGLFAHTEFVKTENYFDKLNPANFNVKIESALTTNFISTSNNEIPDIFKFSTQNNRLENVELKTNKTTLVKFTNDINLIQPAIGQPNIRLRWYNNNSSNEKIETDFLVSRADNNLKGCAYHLTIASVQTGMSKPVLNRFRIVNENNSCYGELTEGIYYKVGNYNNNSLISKPIINSFNNPLITNGSFKGDSYILKYGFHLNERHEIKQKSSITDLDVYVDLKFGSADGPSNEYCETDRKINLEYQFSTLLYTTLETSGNYNYRYSSNEIGASYYPRDKKLVQGDGKGLLEQTPNTVALGTGYNKIYNKRNNLIQFKTKDLLLEKVSDFSNRTIYSDKLIEGQLTDNFRNFKINNYYDLPRNKGEIWDAFILNNNLFLHTTQSLWRTFVNELTQQASSTGEIFLGSGKLFEIPSREIINLNYGGTQTVKSNVNTLYGRIFLDTIQKKIFLFNGENIEDITTGISREIFNLINENTNYNFQLQNNDWDKPQIKKGIHGVFDFQLNRYLITFNNQIDDLSKTFSFSFFNKKWISLHSYKPSWYINYGTRLFNFDNAIYEHFGNHSNYRSIYNNVNELLNKPIYTNFNNIQYDFVIEFVINTGQDINPNSGNPYTINSDDSKIFDNLIIKTTQKNENNNYIENTSDEYKTFDKIIVSNSYQKTNEIDLISNNTDYYFEITEQQNKQIVKYKNFSFNMSIPRQQLTLNNIITEELPRFKDKFIKIRFTYNGYNINTYPQNNCKFVINSIVSMFRINKR